MGSDQNKPDRVYKVKSVRKNKKLKIQGSIRKKIRMCNNRQKMQDQGLPNWQGLYPDLSALFNQQNQHNHTNTRPSFFSNLLALLGIDTSSYISPTQGPG